MAEVVFFIAGIGAVAGAIGVIAARNPFYSVLGLVVHLISLAALFLLLRAEFVAAAQVVVYAGAVMVLYVFVVSYVGGVEESISTTGPGLRVAGLLFGLVLFAELSIAVLGSGLQAIDGEGAAFQPGFGSPGEIGKLLLTKFLLAFEVASFLLLIAAVGAVVLARRRRGLEDTGGFEPAERAEGLSASEVAAQGSTGTMAEGVGAHIYPARGAQ